MSLSAISCKMFAKAIAFSSFSSYHSSGIDSEDSGATLLLSFYRHLWVFY